MQQSSQHIIRRQVLEVELNGTEAEGMKLQRQLADFARDVLPANLEKLLDQMVPPGMVVSLDSLAVEVNLQPDGPSWERGLANAIVQNLRVALAEKLPQNVGDFGVPGSSGAGISTEGEAVLHVFFHFLKTGQLPWNASATLRQQLEMELMKAIGSSPKDSPLLRKLEGLLAENAAARQRLALQFSSKNLRLLAQTLHPSRKQSWLLGLRQMGWLAGQTGIDKSAAEATFWAHFFGKTTTENGLIRGAVQQLWNENPQAEAALRAAAQLEAGQFLKPIMQDIKEADGSPKPTASSSEVGDAANGLFIENAGLVLLHPFLPAYFQAVGLADGPVLKKPGRAVLLLQYLATGQTVVPEHLLALNKLLCGLPLNWPVPKRLRLTKLEKKESRQLLEAVISHWAALKNTSPEGLQGEFLCREGKLSQNQDGEWWLRVERKTADILLSQLPWGFGFIRTPWMGKMLMVEWG